MSVTVYVICNDGHTQNLLELVQTSMFATVSAHQCLPAHSDCQNQLLKADGIADIPDLLLCSKIEGVALKARHRRGREHW